MMPVRTVEMVEMVEAPKTMRLSALHVYAASFQMIRIESKYITMWGHVQFF